MKRYILLLLFLVAMNIGIFTLTIYTASATLARVAEQKTCYSKEEAISLYLCEEYGYECRESN